MVSFEQSGCLRAKLVVFGQHGYIQAKVVVCGQKRLYSDKSGCIPAKVVEMVLFGQSGCIRGKVVVFGQFNSIQFFICTIHFTDKIEKIT